MEMHVKMVKDASAPRIGEDFNFEKLKYKIPSSFYKPVLSDRSVRKGDKKSKAKDSKKESGSLVPPRSSATNNLKSGGVSPKKSDRKVSDIDQENPMLSKSDISMPVARTADFTDASNPVGTRLNQDRNT